MTKVAQPSITRFPGSFGTQLYCIVPQTKAPLTAMRLEIGIMHQLARADTRAIDYEVESFVDIFEFFEADERVDFAASLVKARGEVIEINRGVRERNAHRETAIE